MTTIIAGELQLQDQTGKAIDELVRAGFPRPAISSFFLNPAGQHAIYPIGGDRDASPGANETGAGAVKGAAAAAATGAALGATLSPVGAVFGGLIGAHAGSLIGALSQSKEKGEAEKAPASTGASFSGKEGDANVPVRKAGMMVAVAIKDHSGPDESTAIGILRQCGAVNLEKAEGRIEDGDWHDFDPLSVPHYL